MFSLLRVIYQVGQFLFYNHDSKWCNRLTSMVFKRYGKYAKAKIART